MIVAAVFTPVYFEALRFWSKVDFSGECWRWMAYAQKSGGYGKFRFRGEAHLAHRVAYRLTVGPIPRGLFIDHVRARGCAGGRCVNPAHLEPVTNAENVRREAALRPRRTHCKSGHELTPENTYRYDRSRGERKWIDRHCVICAKAKSLRRFHESRR